MNINGCVFIDKIGYNQFLKWIIEKTTEAEPQNGLGRNSFAEEDDYLTVIL